MYDFIDRVKDTLVYGDQRVRPYKAPTPFDMHADKYRAARTSFWAGSVAVGGGVLGLIAYGGQILGDYFNRLGASIGSHLSGQEIQLVAEQSTTGSPGIDFLYSGAAVLAGLTGIAVGTRGERSLRETQPYWFYNESVPLQPIARTAQSSSLYLSVSSALEHGRAIPENVAVPPPAWADLVHGDRWDAALQGLVEQPAGVRPRVAVGV
jgi:hypothetical protein